MRNREADEEFLRGAVKRSGVDDVVYISDNAYDGGYEVRVGTLDFFVDYETIDDNDAAYVCKKVIGSV